MTISTHWRANFTPFKALVAVLDGFAVSGAAVISVATVVAGLVSGPSRVFVTVSLIGIVKLVKGTHVTVSSGVG